MSSFQELNLSPERKMLVVATDLSVVEKALEGLCVKYFKFVSRPDFRLLSNNSGEEEFAGVIYSSTLDSAVKRSILELNLDYNKEATSPAELRKNVISIRNWLMNQTAAATVPPAVEAPLLEDRDGRVEDSSVPNKVADVSVVPKQGEKNKPKRKGKKALTEDVILASEAEFNSSVAAVLLATQGLLNAMKGISASMKKQRAFLLQCQTLAGENQRLKEAAKRTKKTARQISKLLDSFQP